MVRLRRVSFNRAKILTFSFIRLAQLARSLIVHDMEMFLGAASAGHYTGGRVELAKSLKKGLRDDATRQFIIITVGVLLNCTETKKIGVSQIYLHNFQ